MLLPFIVCYSKNTFVFSTPFRDQLNRFYCPLSTAHRVSFSKISVVNPSYLTLKFLECTITVKVMTDG